MKGDEACYYTAGGASLSTVAGLERQMGQYASLFGVQPSQLAPTLQWFSNDFVCVENQSAATYHNAYGCSTVHPPSGVPTPGYGHVQMLAANSGLDPVDIGVVTGYAGQVGMLRRYGGQGRVGGTARRGGREKGS